MFSCFLNKALNLFNITIMFDASEDFQLLLQHPATYVMDNIIDLHHDIFSIMIIVAAVVFYLIFQII